ncbi:MFS transporter [Sphingobium sp.]|uniref:MFS transporter n=1 Tax=Sphingobium sp. TaxID=1912891 RepID=UPI0028BE4D32|nr:MFS transporter [Sphingobium sp.]
MHAESPVQSLQDGNVRKTSLLVTALCWIALFSEGYDMGALGAVLPSMMADPDWHLDAAMAGMMASAALVGMFFGGYIFGTFADRFGRKPAYLVCFSLFSVASGLAALAPSPMIFAICRFFAGAGVAGIVPIASALTCEYAPPGKANRQYAIMYSGYSVGIFAAALCSFFTVEWLGWRFVVGIGVTALLLLPLIILMLPESIDFLLSQGRVEGARALAARLGLAFPERSLPADDLPKPGVRALFQPGWVSATLGFWFATFSGMILVYGLNTWLPQIMRSAGYELGSSIMFLGVFALASSVGGIMLGAIADRVGRGRTIMAAFLVGAVAILTLSHAWPLPLTYILVAIAGIGSVSAAVMVTSYLAAYFPARYRATAVGVCISFSRFGAVCGPLLGGAIAQRNMPITWNFVVFALAAVGAAASILLVPDRGTKGATFKGEPSPIH